MATLKWRVEHPDDEYWVWTQGGTPSRLFGTPGGMFEDWFERAKGGFREKCNMLNAARRRLELKHGLENYKKRDVLWDRVWREVRNVGGTLDDIDEYYDDLAELVT